MTKGCLESSSTCILCLCEKGKLWRGDAYMVSSEPSPHADEIRTINSCTAPFKCD